MPRTEPAGESACPTKFRRDFSWTLGANIFYAACQWLMLSVLAKACPTAEVGLFSLGLAITAPILMFSNLQLRNVQATDARARFDFKEYLTLRLATTGVALLAILLFAALQPHHALAVVLVVGLSKCFEAVSDVLQGYLQQREHMVTIARSMILKGLLSIALVIVAVSRYRTALAAACALAIGSLAVLLFYDWPVTGKLRGHSSTESSAALRLLPLAWLALPLGIVQGLISLSMNIPRYYLERYAGASELGIFSALMAFIVVGQTAVNALGNVASPRLAQYFAARRLAEFSALLLKIAGTGAALGALGVATALWFGRPLLLLLFGPAYAAYQPVLVLVMVAGAVAYVAWLTGYALTAAQVFRSQIPMLAAVCLASWWASFRFIPIHGIRGAAFAAIASMCVQSIAAVLLLSFTLNRHANPAST